MCSWTSKALTFALQAAQSNQASIFTALRNLSMLIVPLYNCWVTLELFMRNFASNISLHTSLPGQQFLDVERISREYQLNISAMSIYCKYVGVPSKYSTNLHSLTVRARAEILRACLPPSTCHMWHVRCHLSHVTCQMSPVTCHVSPVTCHMFHVTCHMSDFFISFFFFGQSA